MIFTEIFNEFIYFFNEIAIYLVFGFIIAGVLHIFFPDSFILKHLGKGNFSSVVKSSLAGIPLPICSCGVIPVAASLRKKGASKGAALSFLISTPQIGTDSFFMTYSLMGWIFAVFRVIASFITAMFAGILTNIFSKDDSSKKIENQAIQVNQTSISGRLHSLFSYIQVELFGSIANYLLVGILIAALIGVLIPDNFFEQYLGNSFLSMLIILIVAVPMYICATASTPIAASLVMKGLAPGAALVLLLAGPATNAVTISTISKTLGKKVVGIYLASISIVSILLGLILNYFSNVRIMTLNHHMHNNMLPDWIHFMGVLLLVIMFFLHYLMKIKSKFTNNKWSDNMGIRRNLIVNGMSCNHCASSVKKAVLSVEGTDNVEVNLDEKIVRFDFDEVDLTLIKKAIEDQGFDVVKN